MLKCPYCNILYDEPVENGACPECGHFLLPVKENRTRAERRKAGFKKAVRRKKIIRAYGTGDVYRNLHQYADNKIHCSCPMCRAKTSKIKMRKAYGPGGKNWGLSDRKRVEEMQSQIEEQKES